MNWEMTFASSRNPLLAMTGALRLQKLAHDKAFGMPGASRMPYTMGPFSFCAALRCWLRWEHTVQGSGICVGMQAMTNYLVVLLTLCSSVVDQ